VLGVEHDGVRFLVSTDDDVIGRVTFAYRGFDEAAMHALVRVLGERTGSSEPLRGRTIVDVGANIGTTSIYALRRFGAARAIAFEPEPGNLALLRQNLWANELADAVDVRELALSDADGTVEFEISPENSGDHRVRVGGGDAGEMGEQDRRVIPVPARRLDGLIAAGELPLDDVALVWIDVQGHEAHVLAGATAVFDAGIPVSIEYWPYGLERAGGLDRLHQLVAERCTSVVDFGPPHDGRTPVTLPATEVGTLAARYPGVNGFSDLLLLP
jgi:FkbM family methyltransferase